VKALSFRARRADTLVVMAQNRIHSDRREDDLRDDRPAPAWPLSASKTTAARRRDLTEAIRRARAA
jgi:hypothetical protein